jgi:hypothetical protein
MGTKSALPVINEAAGKHGQLTRREMMQRLIAGAGAGAAWPVAAASHPILALLSNEAFLDEAEKLGAADWKPLVLDARQDRTLIALSESILPGSMKAQVNRFLDLLLSVDTAEHRKSFVDSLAAFEAESQRRFGKGFPSLDGSEQNILLMAASAPPAHENLPGSEGKEDSRLFAHFEGLKGWISGAYYSSEAGMRELGWTGDYAFERFPGCEHTEGHH